MLRALQVRDFAVIDAVSVAFEPGFNVLTGETGTGKSILLDALLLLRGARAQADVIRAGAEAALVEAVFEVDGRHPARAVLEEAGLAAEDGQVVVRRELTRAGRHRAFVNDSPVTVGLLERLGDHLIEVHGQHEHQRLLEPVHQLELLDRFAETEEARERVAGLVAKHRAATEALAALRAEARDRAQREDLLRFQVSELDAARLQPGEEEALRAERRRVQHAERLLAGLAEATALLRDDADSAAARLARAGRLLGDLARLDPAFGAPGEALEAAAVQVDEALAGLRVLRDAVDAEPGRLEAIDDRLDVLARLRRKYGDTEAAMLRFRDEAAAALARLAQHEEVLATQERARADLEAELAAAAGALSERRQAAARRLAARVEREIRSLGMEGAVFRIAVEPQPLASVTPRGVDRVEFRLSTSAGEDVKPLARVASGGELSRTMLALKAALARADRAVTMVFDEVDAGIGGRTAAVVADKLAAAAAGGQVLCVTHLAPIAARAGRHLGVTKAVRGGRPRVAVEPLEGEARAREVARMLGGEGAAGPALAHARELLSPPRGRPR